MQFTGSYEHFPEAVSNVMVSRALAGQGEFIFSGGTTVLRALNGSVRLQVRDNGLRLAEDSVIILAPYTPYRILDGSTDPISGTAAECERISFRLYGSLTVPGGELDLGRETPAAQELARLTDRVCEAASRLDALAAPPAERPLSLQIELLSLAAELCRSGEPVPVQSNITDWEVFRNAVEYICGNLGEPLTLGDIADRAGLSAYYFSHIFKAAFGETTIQFVGRLRLYKARGMLMLGKYSVSEIAAACGFRSSASFCTTFKKYYGVSPVSMRKSAARDFFRTV